MSRVVELNRHDVFDGSATAPRQARRIVADALADASGEPVGIALLLVSELVSMGVRHGAPRIAVGVDRRDSLVRVEVVEWTAVIQSAPAPGISAADDDVGHRLIEVLAAQHGREMHSDGMASWFEVEL